MSPEKMIGLSFAAAAAKLCEAFGKLKIPSVCADGILLSVLMHDLAGGLEDAVGRDDAAHT